MKLKYILVMGLGMLISFILMAAYAAIASQ